MFDSDDITSIAQADEAFHDVIFQATDNERLIQLLNNLREQMYRYRIEFEEKGMLSAAYRRTRSDHAGNRRTRQSNGDSDYRAAYQ